MVYKVSEQVNRREKKKLDKKARILNAAALLFSRRQYHEVMIEDVARNASIAKGTVYSYFSSKEEIYFSIMLERMDTLLSTLYRKIKTEADSSNALRSYITHLYMFMMKYQDFFMMYRKETLKAENELCSNIAGMQKQLREMLKEIITRGIDNNIFRNIDPGFAADVIQGTIYASVNRGIERNYTETEMRAERGEAFNFIYEGMSTSDGYSPLKGKVIVLTRSEEQNEESARSFKDSGAEIISFPTLKIIPLKTDSLKRYFSPQPDYLVFTSAKGVEIFAEKIRKDGISIDKKIKIAAVGTRTAEACRQNNFFPVIIPRRQSAEGLMDYFNDLEIAGSRFLLPRSAIGKMNLIEYLEQRNAVVLQLNIYDTVIPGKEEVQIDLLNTEVDVIIFASPSAFRNFLELTGDQGKELLKRAAIASIGDTTSEEIFTYGYIAVIRPEVYSMDGLKSAIIDFYKKEKN
jgi:uroporphyrinogen-III synthase/AcrR family transcriptional regulator